MKNKNNFSPYCKNCTNRYIKLTLGDCSPVHISSGPDCNEVTCRDINGNVIKNKIPLSKITNGY